MEQYNKTNWNNNQPPALNAANLNKIENGIEAAVNGINELDSGKLSSAAGAVKTANIDTGAVTEAKLAANSVTTAKIKDGNVTEAKLATAFKDTLYKVDTTARSNITSADIDSKKIYTNFTINYNGANRKAIVMNFDSTQTFIALCADGMIFTRTVGAGWQCIYNPNDKTTSITNSNKSSNILFPTIKAVVDYIAALFATVINNDNKSSNALLPTIKAVVDYLTANYIGNGSGTVTENNLATVLKNSLYHVDNTTETVAYSADNPRTIYTNARVYGNKPTLVFTLGDHSQLAMHKDGHLYCRTFVNGKYSDWIDLKAVSITESNKTSGAYPTVRAVYNFVTAFVASAISGKMDAEYAEDIRYKVEELNIAIAPNPEDEEYPSAYAAWKIANDVYDSLAPRITGNSADIADLQAYLGYTSPDILGLCVDLENNRFTRLAGAAELEAGSDFDAFPMFGGRRRCCVANDGTINAYYGEQGYAEDGTNGQVMVYQPKFYYRMVPLKLEKQASGLGYHIRKANYYVTATPHPGFKLHPLFYDANGNEVDYVLLSAYEGSMYDVSESAYVNDGVDSISYASGDLLCSVSGKKPISGKLTTIGTRMNFENMAQTRGTSWHLDTIQSVSANQLLMMIELGTLNVQSAVGSGVVTVSDNDNYNCASLTGATASLGNATGMASTTIGESAGTETIETTNGKLSVSYRGVENPWGNIWKYINGLNLWGNGSMNGGQAYICSDFTFSDSDRTQHYQPSGFTVSNSIGYASAFGYGDEAYDWLMIPSECAGRSIEPVCDQSYFKPNLNEFNIARFGGSWNSNTNGGAYCWGFVYAPGFRYYFLGGRLLYVPTASV